MMDEQQLLDGDLRARTDSLDVSRSFIVQAPAGSGKTELLIQRYLKLLSVVDNPEEVLAITFTRKAAAEMQLRVLGALRTAQRGEQAAEEHQRLTAQLAEAALRRDQEFGWQIVANPRRLRIQTLDSLNAMIARWRPISSPETASGLRIAVDSEFKSLLREASLATLEWLTEDGEEATALREVLGHVDNNTALYAAYLEQMLATRDQWLPIIGSGALTADEADALRRQFERSLEATVIDQLKQTASAIPAAIVATLTGLQAYAADNLSRDDSAANIICALQGVSGLPAVDGNSMAQWHALAELLLTQSGQFRKRVDKRQGFPPKDDGQKDSMHAMLAVLTEQQSLAELLHGVRTLPPVHYSDEQWQVLLALFRLLPLAVVALKRLFAERAVADHIEVSLTAAEALGSAEVPGDVALLLDYQVRHLLIDEMQDTSGAQYRMLEALTGGWEPGDGRSLYCVGDPMQSIYRFRNAEVAQFLIAQERGIGAVTLIPLLLRRNFRSGQFLVDWFNTVFPEIMPHENAPSSGAVAYSEAVSVPQLAGQGRCHVHPVFGASVRQEATIGCRVIAETLTAHPEDQVAVLVRGRTQLPSLLAELRKAGIAYQAVDIDRLTDLPEVIEVVALTRAAVHRGDRLAWLALLRAAWIGLSWQDLHALVFNDTASTIWECLQDEHKLAALSETGRLAIESVRDVLAQLVAPRRSQTLRELVESSWIRLGGPAILNDQYEIDNVYRYLDVVERHERGGTLSDVADLEATLDLERVSSHADARLQVMTMHRAKGLQFEHVVLFGLGRQVGRGERRVLSWFDVPGAHGDVRKVISPVGPRAEVDADPIHRFIELREAAKYRHEQARLLYVACTRARSSLQLIGHCNLAADGEQFSAPAKGSLLHLLWPALAPQYEDAFADFVPPNSTDDSEPWMLPVLRRFASSWTLPAVATPVLVDAAAPADVDEEVEFYWVGTEARIAGTVVHRWLQAFAKSPRMQEPQMLPRWRPVTQRWLREMGVAEKQRGSIAERVELALQGILGDEKGRWLLAGEGHAELALSGLYEGRIESVVLDRVRIDEQGQHWIVDYKTSTHEGGNLAGFLHAETERYRPQLRKYRAIYQAYTGVTAGCALYFPLLRSFLEVDA